MCALLIDNTDSKQFLTINNNDNANKKGLVIACTPMKLPQILTKNSSTKSQINNGINLNHDMYF